MGCLWGLTSLGGDSGGGVIFEYDKQKAYDSIVYQLPFPPNTPFYSNLMQATDGNFYGMTESGGDYGEGAIFKINATTGKLTTLVNFSGTNGSIPYGSLIQASDGNLYGMTYGGGTSYLGVLFKCTTSGIFSVLLNFNNTNGSNPYGSLIQASDGNLYGMTSGGGSSNEGTLFKCTTSGALTTLVSFNISNGSRPYGNLIQAVDGNFYGMTSSGGSSDSGTVFKCTTAGSLTTLINFTGANGNAPYGSLLQVSGDNLYGMTESGGASGLGTVFKCNLTGILTTLANFSDTNGATPFGNLILGANGNLYGLTEAGDSIGNGTLFQCDTLGNISVIVDFDGADNGANPQSSLLLATDGNFYGMCNQGGSSGLGTIFKCTPSGSLSNLIVFGVTDIGSNPGGSLMQARNGNLYGMTYGGGSNGYDGTIFKIDNNTHAVSTILNFNDSNGANPYGSLIQGMDGDFYGMTEAGGTTSLSNTEGGSAGDGVVFKFNPNTGVITTLVNLTGVANGAAPFGTLIQGSDGYLYGMTEYGGTSHEGTIFKCDTNGAYTLLVSFNGVNGKFPFNSLIQGLDGNLYGMTQYGGTSNDGTLFKCTTIGALTTLVNFNGTNGSNPMGSLIQAYDSALYGMAVSGGTADDGVLFKCTTSGTLTTLVNFTGANGTNPGGSLIQASDSNLYGMTEEGGLNSRGTVFMCTTTGVLTTLINFNWNGNGASPQYGHLLEVMSTSISVSANCSGVFTLTDSVRGAKYPCTYSWSNGSTTSSISGVSSLSTYSVTVTDSRGITVNANVSVPAFTPLTVSTTGTITDCSGKSVNLSAIAHGTATGTITYLWMPGDLTGASPVVSPTITTTYTVIATDAAGCKDSATQVVQVDSLPSVSISGKTLITTGSYDTLTATGGGTYLWSNGSTSDTNVVRPSVNTTYTVTVTGVDGCTNTATYTVSVSPSGIDNISSSEDVIIYPVPVTNVLSIQCNKQETGSNAIVKILDISGREIVNRSITIEASISLNVNFLAEGMYFAEIITGKNTMIKKFVKE